MHIFGTADSHNDQGPRYFTYDIATETMSRGPVSFDQRRVTFEGCKAIFSQHLNKLLVIGGGDDEKPFSSEMYEISFGKLDCTHYLPTALSCFGIVCFKHFVLLFGGSYKFITATDLIYVFDLNECRWRQSKMRLRSSGNYHAVLLKHTVYLFKPP